MQVNITNSDVSALKKFMLLHSKMAKKQKFVSFYAIPFEFFLVGIVLDGVFKKAPILTISSLILAALWLLIYPKFYKGLIAKHIANADNSEISNVKMNFEVKENEVIFGESSKNAEIFSPSELKRLAKSENNFFLAFNKNFHMVLPRNDQTEEILKQLSNKTNIEIESVEI